MPAAYLFTGSQEFHIVGSGRHEDTLRVESNSREKERPFRLVLPTLCITYAKMEFANRIGGQQANYPASRSYGPAFFDPPVVINGAAEIEKLTWIRGADRVVIGPAETEIFWRPWRKLVVPRLRVERDKPATGVVKLENTPIPAGTELVVTIKQYSDGRHTGGARIAKRHPDWKPPEIEKAYDLWVRVTNGVTLRPMPEVLVRVFRWDPRLRTPYGTGGFRLTDRIRTDGWGAVRAPGRPADEIEAVSAGVPGAWTRARCFRPLPGQNVRMQVRAWPLLETSVAYTWRPADDLRSVAALTGLSPSVLLKRLGLARESDLKAGLRVKLPCWAACVWLEPGETLPQLAKTFAYGSVEALVKANGTGTAEELEAGGKVLLPGWNFFYARKGDALPEIDRQFELPRNSARLAGKVYRPEPRLPLEGEVIAVPAKSFRKANAKYF
jgi:hypothetical protein